MSSKGYFLINEKMRLMTKHFCLECHKVDYTTLLLESSFKIPGREVYFKSGLCSVIVQFDGRRFDMIYSERTVWNNRLLQHWLRLRLKQCIIEVASKVLPERAHYWEQQKGIKAKSVSVKVLRKGILGLCNTNGRIVLAPNILLMPEKYMDSVILHEMAHLRYPHHRNSFWNYLSKLLGEDSRAQKINQDVEMSLNYMYLDYIMKK